MIKTFLICTALMSGVVINITVGDKDFEYGLEDFGALGGFGSSLIMPFDEGAVAFIVDEIGGLMDVEAIDASYGIDDGEFVIKGGIAGYALDRGRLTDDIIAGLEGFSDSGEGGGFSVHGVVNRIAPVYGQEDFMEATELLGSFATPIVNNNRQRGVNLAVASGCLDNSVIMPGEVFSLSAAFGPRLPENGYVMAGQITDGRPDSGFGGGICQIASTLYMAALYAELDVVERQNHSLMVSYTPPATDAAIAEGAIDLKIKNSTEAPVLLQSILLGDVHIVNVYGKRQGDVSRIVEFEVMEGEVLADGRVLYELYKVVRFNGEVFRERVNVSRYRVGF